ncbi:MAG: hypothetical protein ACYCOU_02640 [Sulfobacillus sp.]
MPEAVSADAEAIPAPEATMPTEHFQSQVGHTLICGILDATDFPGIKLCVEWNPDGQIRQRELQIPLENAGDKCKLAEFLRTIADALCETGTEDNAGSSVAHEGSN